MIALRETRGHSRIIVLTPVLIRSRIELRVHDIPRGLFLLGFAFFSSLRWPFHSSSLCVFLGLGCGSWAVGLGPWLRPSSESSQQQETRLARSLR